MARRHIVERLRARHEGRANLDARQAVIRAYEEERDEAADEIQRLEDQLSVVHASAADNEYSQWERIIELEGALGDVLRVFGKPMHEGSVYGNASYKEACEVVIRARAALAPPRKPPGKIFCFH